MTTPRARIFSPGPPRIIPAAAALAALSSVGGGAAADGIVVESASRIYQVTDRVATGAAVLIEPGEHVVILDQRGDLHRISTPGEVFDDRESAGGTERDAADVVGSVATAAAQIVAGAGSREELGAVRAATACGGPAVAPNASIACARNAPQAHLEALLLDGGALRAGEPLRYSLTATVALETLCEVGASDGSWRTADGSPAATPVRLQPNETVVVPAPGAPGAGLPTPAGVSLLRCYGVDPTSWRLLAPHLPGDAQPHLVRALASEFTGMRGGVFLETAVAFDASR